METTATDFEQKIKNLADDLEDAYRKWKSAAYFDPYLAIDANRLACFESRHKIRENREFFLELAATLLDPGKRSSCFDKLFSEIRVRCFPKINPNNSVTGSEENVLKNIPEIPPLETVQYMIDLPVKAHLIGTLWIMKIGRYLDDELDDQCYGNRIRKNLFNEPDKGPTPYLYYPYFKKYESWRDEALSVVEGLLDLNLNVVMVSLDIKGYFYNCRVNFNELETYLENETKISQQDLIDYEYLNEFINGVFNKYASIFQYENNLITDSDPNPFIPIGFLPSYVISNWYLADFDKAVKKLMNPQYYGRYVDDILLVISVNDEKLQNMDKAQILKEIFGNYSELIAPSDNDESILEIKKVFLHKAIHGLSLQNKKIKVFYFSYNHSRELIVSFKKRIAQQSSVFLYLHENDDVFIESPSKVWKIHYSDTHNKLRSVENLKVDKFELSKWLSILVNFSGSIDSELINEIIKVLFETLSGPGYINNFNLWEKYLTFFFKHSKFEEIKRFIKELIDEISAVKLKDDFRRNGYSIKTSENAKPDTEIDILQDTLHENLYSILMKIAHIPHLRDRGNNNYGLEIRIIG